MENASFFVEDIYLQGMIYAMAIRSPIANGNLVEIKVPHLPNSYMIITAKDIPGKNSLANFSIPILADKQLSYIGQPLALVAGPERTILEEIALGVEIITEKKEPVFSGMDAETNDVIVSRDFASGDSFFGENAKIISGRYETGLQEHWYPEATGAVAEPFRQPPDGVKKGRKDAVLYTVYSPSQWPFHVKRSVAMVLGTDSETINVRPACLASHLDGKIWYPSLIACHAALAAHISGGPVKVMLTREEDFLNSPKRNRSDIKISSSIGEKGEILGSSVNIKLDLGSYAFFEDEIIDQTCIGALDAYTHGSFNVKAEGIRTNIPPQGPMAGFGLSQGLFAAERHISHIADSLGHDPAEWRKQNYNEKNLAIGIKLKEKPPLVELIDSVTAMSDYRRKWASYELLRHSRRKEPWKFSGDPIRGIGISTGFQGSGFLYNNESGNGNCTVELTLEKDGSLEIKTSVIPYGDNEIWRNLAHEILGVDIKAVRFINANDVPDSGVATLSRSISFHTGLVERCCMDIKNLRFHDPLPITVRHSAKPVSEQEWLPGKKANSEAFASPGWGAAVAEIEINQVTLEPKIRGIWMAVDGGKIFSLRRSHWTLRTGIIQSAGWVCCTEQVYYKNGSISPGLFRTYNISGLSEIPPIYVDFIQNNTETPKGIGDLPFCCVPAAYVQAVSQAMDHHFEKIPVNASDIMYAGKLKQTEDK